MTSAVPLPDRSARREALLDAADRAVERDGPATSMAAVAASAGISKPILYRHFGDKGGLVAALADRHTDRLMRALREALAAGRSRRERVELTIDAYLAAIEASPQLYRFLLRPEGAVTPEQVRTFTRRVGELLAQGIANEIGQDTPSPREQAWAHGIVGMVQTAGDWWLDTGAGRPRARRLRGGAWSLSGGVPLGGGGLPGQKGAGSSGSARALTRWVRSRRGGGGRRGVAVAGRWWVSSCAVRERSSGSPSRARVPVLTGSGSGRSSGRRGAGGGSQ